MISIYFSILHIMYKRGTLYMIEILNEELLGDEVGVGSPSRLELSEIVERSRTSGSLVLSRS